MKNIKRIISAFFVTVMLVQTMFCFSVNPFALPNNVVAKGIDVSYWQQNVDYEKVKTAGVTFVIIRAGTTYGKDSFFEKNYTAAKKAGLNVGCYFFTYALNTADAKKDAETFVSYIGDKQFDYPIFMDYEYEKMLDLTKSQRTSICSTFMDVLKSKNYYTGIYLIESWYDSTIDRSKLTKCDTYWIANISAKESDIPRIKGKAGMWQYKIGPCAGISGDVDVDYSFVDYPKIIKNGGYNNYPKPTPTPQPEEKVSLWTRIKNWFVHVFELIFKRKVNFLTSIIE